ncbi:MAG: VOC family protein [Acidimicrobiaceae bacterium]|nr:VOC family protein [Acidimicrobiaceae bacterium]
MRLRSVSFGVRDIEGQARFLRDVFGLVPEDSQNGCVRFSAPGSIEPAITTLRQAPMDRADAVAFGVDSRSLVDQMHDHLVGLEADLVGRPGPTVDGGYGFEVFDPEGHLLSISAGTAVRTRPPHERGKGLPLDVSHVVFNSSDNAALADWYCTALGFRVTDWLEDRLVFMTTSRYHHQVALAATPVSGLNHVAYECADIDDFMRATGRAMRHGHEILWGPGRHGPGDNAFAYFRSPAGFVCEFTTELAVADSPDWVVRTWEAVPEQSDLWGTSNPRPPAFGASGDPGLGIIPGSPEELRAAA